jgi:hypothetical protein
VHASAVASPGPAAALWTAGAFHVDTLVRPDPDLTILIIK